MWEELGISSGTAIIVLVALYWTIKGAVKNGIKQAYRDITGSQTSDDKVWEKAMESFVESCKPRMKIIVKRNQMLICVTDDAIVRKAQKGNKK